MRLPTTSESDARPTVWAVIGAAILVAGALGTFANDQGSSAGGTDRPAGAAAEDEPGALDEATPTTAATSRQRHPLVQLVAGYDRAYANVVGDRAALYDGAEPARHGEVRNLLTDDSPLWPARIWHGGAEFLDDPTSVRAIQVTPTPGDWLRPGERIADLPITHELLGGLPAAEADDRTAATVPVCIHADWVIRPEGDPAPWIQAAADGEAAGEMTFRVERGRWRLHDWTITGEMYGGEGRSLCEARCGPDPAGTAHRLDRPEPDGAGGIEVVPTPEDPPCPT